MVSILDSNRPFLGDSNEPCTLPTSNDHTPTTTTTAITDSAPLTKTSTIATTPSTAAKKKKTMEESAPPLHPPPPPLSSSSTTQTTPFKLLVSGTTLGLTFVSNCREPNLDIDINASSESPDVVFPSLHGIEATIVPVVSVQLFNPLCSVSYSAAGYRWEGSCFNMAVSYSSDDGSCGK